MSFVDLHHGCILGLGFKLLVFLQVVDTFVLCQGHCLYFFVLPKEVNFVGIHGCPQLSLARHFGFGRCYCVGVCGARGFMTPKGCELLGLMHIVGYT